VLPPLRPYPDGNKIAPEALTMSDRELQRSILNMGDIEGQFFGLSFRLENGVKWDFPTEPLVSLKGKNNIVRRNVAKTSARQSGVRGTVKERWSQDDYGINISGTLRNFLNMNEYPRAQVEMLRRFCEARQVIHVENPLFEIFNITQIVIEDYDIPFTGGEDLQAYTINAHSDFMFELLIDKE
jgi:hypothetical protein